MTETDAERLTPRERRAALGWLALTEEQRKEFYEPGREWFSIEVARVIRAMDLLTDREWRRVGAYIRAKEPPRPAPDWLLEMIAQGPLGPSPKTPGRSPS